MAVRVGNNSKLEATIMLVLERSNKEALLQ
jgi:hypothetical protein